MYGSQRCRNVGFVVLLHPGYDLLFSFRIWIFDEMRCFGGDRGGENESQELTIILLGTRHNARRKEYSVNRKVPLTTMRRLPSFFSSFCPGFYQTVHTATESERVEPW